jgi:hypothetical protein
MKPKKRLKNNSKTTEITCIRCRTIYVARRNDSKTCSDLCRIQEAIERKEKGYISLVLRGNLKEIQAFITKISDFAGLSLLYNELFEIRNAIKENDKLATWKIEAKGFRLTNFPRNKKTPFELYFTKSKFRIYNLHYGTGLFIDL